MTTIEQDSHAWHDGYTEGYDMGKRYERQRRLDIVRRVKRRMLIIGVLVGGTSALVGVILGGLV